MRKRRMEHAGILLSLTMVIGLIGVNTTSVKSIAEPESETKLKSFTISNQELERIVGTAGESGVKAANLVNALEGDNFEAAVHKVMTAYYEKDQKALRTEFEKNVNHKADDMIAGFEEAAVEREKADELPYEVGTSLVSFGADITEEEIKEIVADQYGECEYIHKSPDGTYMVKVRNSLGLTTEKAVEAYDSYSQTTYTDMNQRVEMAVEAYELVNDLYVGGQYYLRTMNVADAWQYVRGVGHSKIKVSVIDGGIDINTNVDLRASSSQSVEILDNGGMIPLSQSTATYDISNMHGINVAGIISATANNGAQIAGVASCINNDVVDMINIKIPMYVDKIVVGIDYSLNCGVKVINMSLFHEGANDAEKAAIDRFVASGGTVVCGAGNNGSDIEGYPSDYDNTISVVSVDENYNIAGSSNRGWRKDICAPGVGIYAPGWGDTVWIVHGTSMASPMVAGVVAMMYSVNPGLNATTSRNILIDTATDLGEPGRDYTYAYGFVNAYKAVVSAAGGNPGGEVTQPQTTTPSSGGLVEVFGQNISSDAEGLITVVWGNPGNGQLFNVYLDGVIASDINGQRLQNVGCANYTIPASPGMHTVRITGVLNGQETAGVTGQVNVAGQIATEPPTTAPPSTKPGYTPAGANWTELDYWSVYFASGWGNDPTGSYRNGGSYNDFGVYVEKYSGAPWGIQIKTKVLSAKVGTTYVCKASATFNVNMSDTVLFKDEGTQTSKEYTLVQGNNNFEIEFVPTADNTQIVFDLGMLPEGGEFVVTSFSLEEKEQPTEPPTTEEPTTRTFDAFERIEAEHFASNQGGVIDTNGNASGGYNVGGIANGTSMEYQNVIFSEPAGAVEICYSSPIGVARGNVEIYADNWNNKVGEVTLTNNASSWQEYGQLTAMLSSDIATGNHTIYLKYVTTGEEYYVANVDYFRFVKKSEIETEPPTEEPTTEPRRIEGGIEINGYQVSATAKGMRTVYSVDSEIDGMAVVSSGMIYSLADYAGEEELHVESTHDFVRSFKSTTAGVLSRNYSDSDAATSYAMTMLFATREPIEYQTTFRIRAYAELSDGSYVYSEIYEYTIYEIANELYQGCKMSRKEYHDYLYTDILSIVNKEYEKKEYPYNDIVSVSVR